MIFKLGLKNLKRSIFMNILIILQMTVIFVIAISMTSTIVSRFQYYTPVKDLLNSNSYYYYIHYGINPETGSVWTNTNELKELVNGEKEMYATYNAWLDYYKDGTLENLNTISYDNEFIQMYQPELESGTWFDMDYSSNNDLIPIVISQNNLDIHTGDIIELTGSETNEKVNAVIIGMLKDGTKILDYTIANNQKMNCKNMYKNYFFEIEEKPLLIMPQRCVEYRNIYTQVNGPLVVTYDEYASDKDINSNHSVIKSMMTLSALKTKEIKNNSIEYIFSQFYTLLPILIAVLIMTFVSAVSTSALTAKRQLKNYAVYYICGLKWRDCALINLTSSIVLVAISMGISIFGIEIFGNSILAESVIEFGIIQFTVCIFIAVMYVILSILMPFQIVKNNSSCKVLKSN